MGGISAFPTVGAYHASTVEGFSQSLAQEVQGCSIHVTLVEPGGFSTDWSGPSATHSGRMDICDEVREAAAGRPTANNPGDPTATRGAILRNVVDAENPPLCVFFGKTPLDIATKDCESRLATWTEWQSVSIEAHGNQLPKITAPYKSINGRCALHAHRVSPTSCGRARTPTMRWLPTP